MHFSFKVSSDTWSEELFCMPVIPALRREGKKEGRKEGRKKFHLPKLHF
jgi:hypothetical protein